MCLKSLRRNYSDYKIKIVTQENISQFVNFPPLQREFFKRYNPDRFEQIKAMSHFHELTWKYPPQKLTPEISTGKNFEYVMKFLS